MSSASIVQAQTQSIHSVKHDLQMKLPHSFYFAILVVEDQ